MASLCEVMAPLNFDGAGGSSQRQEEARPDLHGDIYEWDLLGQSSSSSSLGSNTQRPRRAASDDLEMPDMVAGLSLSNVAHLLVQQALPLLPAVLQRQPPALSTSDWLQTLADDDGTQTVLDRKGLTAKGGLFSEDHLFKSMARRGMLRDNRVLFSPRAPGTSAGRVYNVYALAGDVCGHKGIVHGGLSSAIMDETFGYLLYLAHREGLVPGLPLLSAMTAHLEVEYTKPLRAGSTVVCVAEVERIEGRKLWLSAQLLDRPFGTQFATGRALFVVPKASVPVEPVEGTEADV